MYVLAAEYCFSEDRPNLVLIAHDEEGVDVKEEHGRNGVLEQSPTSHRVRSSISIWHAAVSSIALQFV